MSKEIVRILIAGEGGQGVQSIAHIFTEAAFSMGLNVAFLPNYGVEQRGGVSLGFIQISKGPIGFPKFSTADYIVNMRERAIPRIDGYVGDETIYIYDSDIISSSELSHITSQKLAIPASGVAANKLNPRVANMIMAGALLAEIGIIPLREFEAATEKHFGAKYAKAPQFKHLNKKAIELGMRLAKEAYSSSVIPTKAGI